MTHPPSGRAIPTNVAEPLIVISIRSTKGHLLYRLINEKTFCVVLDDSQAIARYVQNRAYRSPPRVLAEFIEENRQIKFPDSLSLLPGKSQGFRWIDGVTCALFRLPWVLSTLLRIPAYPSTRTPRHIPGTAQLKFTWINQYGRKGSSIISTERSKEPVINGPMHGSTCIPQTSNVSTTLPTHLHRMYNF